MRLNSEFVNLGGAVRLRKQSTIVRLTLMAAIAALLYAFADWRMAPAWWAAYAALQLTLNRFPAEQAVERQWWIYGLSTVSYAVAGFPAWRLWTQGGDLGIAAATMFLCGMLVQLIVSSLGARRLFWASAPPLIIYLIVIPFLYFAPHRLTEGVVASICAVFLTGYLTVLWMGQQKALASIETSRLKSEAMQREAEGASQAKTDFLAAMSHELRTPMNAVLGSADLLKRTDLNHEQTELVTMLSDGGQALMHVLNDVLDMAKIEAGMLSIDPTNVDLHDFVRRCTALWRPRAQDKGLDFELTITERTPQFMVVDATRTGQIIFNLISNALKFTESGLVALALDAELVTAGRYTVSLSVTDSGIGMSPETLNLIFSAFQQADSSISRKFGGTGLGLSISQKLAEMMGGQVGVTSREGVGSTFTLRLPCAIGETATLAEPEAQTQDPQALRSVRILLAEDNTSNQRIIDLFLRPIGAQLTIVGDGQQALDALAKTPFDLVLMDMQMPVMDGLEATRRLRAGGGLNSDIPVLALTANVLESHVNACLAAGMTNHIAKPIDARVLLAGVFSALDGQSTGAQALAS